MTASRFGQGRKPEPEDGTGQEIPLVAPKKGAKAHEARKGVTVLGGGPQPAKEGVSVLHKP